MSGADEEWVAAAMTDDAMVVELLVRLQRAPPPPPLKPAALPLEWSVRQRRSKSVTVNNHPKKPARSHRASPTTPLSWSGATSFSGGSAGAGSEESSRLIPFQLSSSTRSKVNVYGEKTNSKRSSRKKKTLAELKDEESSLLKERRDLKREMVALRMNLERQRAKNEKLKRMKIDVQPSPESTSAAEEESVSGQLQQESTPCHPTTTTTTSLTTPVVSGNDVTVQSSMSNADHNSGNADAAPDSKFILPDLNIAFDEPGSDGIS